MFSPSPEPFPPIGVSARFPAPDTNSTETSARNRASSRAFSLVEVVLALGVVSFAFVSLLGLMSAGYSGLRESTATSLQSQILQGLSSEIQMLDYSVLTDGTGDFRSSFPRFYDDEGQRQDTKESALYQVTISLAPAGIPVAGGARKTSSSARQISVKISSVNDANSWRKYNLWSVNNGR